MTTEESKYVYSSYSYFPPFALPTLSFPRDSRVCICICVLIDMGFGKCIPVCAYLISDFEGRRLGRTSERRFVHVREFVGFEISKPIFYLKKEVIVKCNKRNKEGKKKKEMLI